MINILHLTHTEILHDARILKEMQTIANFNKEYNMYGIGVVLDEGSSATNDSDRINVYTIALKSRTWKFLPTVLRHILTLFELTFKMFFHALQLKPHVVHCHDTLVLPLGVFIKICLRCKLIYDAHELESNRNGLSKSLGKMTLLTEKFLWTFIDKLIVVSPSIQNWYNQNLKKKSSEVILNSPVLKSFDEVVDKNYLRNKFFIPKTSKIFIYIGILGKGRGIEDFLEVFKNKDINSHLVFCGYGELKDDLIQISKIFKNIHIHDAVPHERVVSIAKSADIGLCFVENVSLSDYYCLPNKLFEYAFAEIPVLASSFPDITMVVERYKLGKCSNTDYDSMYKVIKEFEEIENLLKINKNDLYDLSWAAQKDKLIKLYENIIDEIKKEKK